MGKGCSYHDCKNHTKKKHDLKPDLFYVPFPKPKTNREKCERWITICRPHEEAQTFIEKITKNHYICSEHFEGGRGPTTTHPDPVMPPEFLLVPNGTSLQQQIMPPLDWTMGSMGNGSLLLAKFIKDVEILRVWVNSDSSLEVLIRNSPIPASLKDTLPSISNVVDVIVALNAINKWRICGGSNESHLVELYSRINHRSNKARLCDASQTIFSSDCALIATKNGARCQSCTVYRNSLRHMNSNEDKPRVKTMNNMSLQELKDEFKTLKKENKYLRVQLVKEQLARREKMIEIDVGETIVSFSDDSDL